VTDPTTGATRAGADVPAVQARPILTTQARLALRVLSESDVAAVHAAALELLGAEGAAAEAAAQSAPSAFVLAGRVPEHDVALGAGRVWLAAGAATAGEAGAPERVRRLAGGDSVPATAADLDEVIRLADALPEVAVLAGPPLRAAGVSVAAALARCLSGSSKHVLAGLLTSVAGAEVAVELAAAVAGSADEVRRRPPLSLCGGVAALDAALVFARAGLPVGLVLAPADAAAGVAAQPSSPSATAETAVPPAPDLGPALIRHHAGVLAGCAAVQAAVPGAPFFYVADPMVAGLPPAGPQASLFQLAAAQLAAHAGLPLVAGGLRTTSHEPDWQACQQDAFVAMTTTASGADVTGGAGLLGAASAFSPQQLVMDTEIFSWNAFIAAGIAVDEETIALDVIEQVGIGGNYLGQRHTRRHMKEVWRPRLLDRTMWDAWIATGREGAYEKATVLAEQLLAEHTAVPLGAEARGVIERIIAGPGL
jgi:trimethylamine--corrinoid protein Co-methyltransferase